MASEVRNLALRSSQAALDIKALIDTSIQGISLEAQQAEKAGTSIQDIVKAAEQVNQIIHDIAATSNEQASGLNQVHHAMEQMDLVTRQNTQLVDELGQTVQQLNFHAQDLNQAIQVLSR